MSLILSFCLLCFAMHAILVSLIPKLDVPHSGIQRLAGLKLAVDVILIPISLFLSLNQSPEIWDVPHFVILLIVFCYACHFGVPHSKVGCPTFWDSEGGRSEIGCRCDSYPYITVLIPISKSWNLRCPSFCHFAYCILLCMSFWCPSFQSWMSHILGFRGWQVWNWL